MSSDIAAEVIAKEQDIYSSPDEFNKYYDALRQLALDQTKHKTLVEAFSSKGDLLVKFIYKFFEKDPEQGLTYLKLFTQAIDSYGNGCINRIICCPQAEML